jgi:hypothetical protein
VRELNPSIYDWSTTQKTNRILADIWDALMLINNNLVAIGSNKPAKKHKPYPRPWKPKADDEKHIGSDGLPPDELQKWFDKKREEHNARSSTSHHNSDSGPSGGSTVAD